MARPKKTTPPAEIVDITAGDVQLVQQIRHESALVEAQHDARVRALAERIGYQLPADATDPDLIQRDINANMRRSVEACLEVGRGLLVLKEVCAHGEFTARLEVLAIDPRVAQRFMASATRFSNAASTPLLKAAGNQTKLFELLVLDDGQVEELELTGQTGELTLDDVASMSVKELRLAVREERAKAEIKDRQIAAKNELLDKREAELDKLTHGGRDTEKRLAAEREQAAIKTFQDASLELLGAIHRFDLAVADCLVEQTEARVTLAEQTVTWLFQRIAQVALDRGMPVDFRAVVDPLSLNAED